MKNRYLTEAEIDDMAIAAMASYEVQCNWSRSWWAAKEYCQDEIGIIPSKSAVSLAVNKAKLKWEAISTYTKKVINNEA